MQMDTNHLVDMALLDEAEKSLKNEEGYEPLPDNMQHAARVALAGNKDVYISRNSGGKLSKFAAKCRKDRMKALNKSRPLGAKRRS